MVNFMLGFICPGQKYGGSNSAGDIHFHFELFALFPSSQLGEGNTNEIKLDIHPEYYAHREKDIFY